LNQSSNQRAIEPLRIPTPEQYDAAFRVVSRELGFVDERRAAALTNEILDALGAASFVR
jgi:hypothetical protein